MIHRIVHGPICIWKSFLSLSLFGLFRIIKHEGKRNLSEISSNPFRTKASTRLPFCQIVVLQIDVRNNNEYILAIGRSSFISTALRGSQEGCIVFQTRKTSQSIFGNVIVLRIGDNLRSTCIQLSVLRKSELYISKCKVK